MSWFLTKLLIAVKNLAGGKNNLCWEKHKGSLYLLDKFYNLLAVYLNIFMSENVIYASSEKKDDRDELDHLVHLIIK